MKKSIRLKLFISITLLVMAFVLLSWLANTQFLEKYYVYQEKNVLLKNSTKINESYSGNPESILLELEKFENSTGANIMIFDSNGVRKYDSFSRTINQKRFDRNPPPEFKDKNKLIPPKNVPRRQDPILSILGLNKFPGENYAFEIQKDIELKIDFLALKFWLKNGDILAVRTPLPAIAENVNIANRFMMFTGIVVLILGIMWAYLFSKKFTKPILELNKITQNMAKLDFTKKCIIKNKDELGELSKNINFLSGKLDSAISELNEKNQKLTEDIERERKIDEMRKEFVSNVSHELKTPIALIEGYAEGLKANITEDEESRNFYCDVIVSESLRMDKLVKDLLNLSQIESGFFKIEREDFDISYVIEDIINKYKTILEEKQINLDVEKSDNVFVNGDVSRIEQVIMNYINNAINHVDDKRIIKITVTNINNAVRVFVYNSGKHIPEECLDKIWGSFYKVDKARTRSYGGSGLGLSIVKAIQEQHNNVYGVENVENGVVFWFEVDKK
jgi:signal transduction histidine kinase